MKFDEISTITMPVWMKNAIWRSSQPLPLLSFRHILCLNQLWMSSCWDFPQKSAELLINEHACFNLIQILKTHKHTHTHIAAPALSLLFPPPPSVFPSCPPPPGGWRDRSVTSAPGRTQVLMSPPQPRITRPLTPCRSVSLWIYECVCLRCSVALN